MNNSLETFLEEANEFLAMEQEAEKEKFRVLLEGNYLSDICDIGLAIQKLQLIDKKRGFGNRIILKFGSRIQGHSLPFHKFGSGDCVSIAPAKEFRNILTTGVVSKVTESTISVAISEGCFVDNETMLFCMIMSPNNVTFDRLKATVKMLQRHHKYPGLHFVEMLFENGHLDQGEFEDPIPEKWFNESLNEDQRMAVTFCCNQRRKLALIHGPPGTGKTTTVVEVIMQAVAAGQSVLLCAPSNVAVDTVIQKLLTYKVKALRLGNPARFMKDIGPVCLDAALQNSSQHEVIQYIRTEIDRILRHKPSTEDLKSLKKEMKHRENKALKEVFAATQVLCCTLTSVVLSGAMGKFVDQRQAFDLLVIDECTQAPEIACWAALLLCKRCVIAGDNKQLGPTIVSEEAASRGLGGSLMDRLMKELDPSKFVRMLTLQYRMHEAIMKWSSAEFYDGKLVAYESNRTHLLIDLSNVTICPETEKALWFINTAGCGMNEIGLDIEESKANLDEVELTRLHCERLVASGVRQEDIAIISPYNFQVCILKLFLNETYEKVRIRTIDGFQGQESEVVILSLVRSNNKGQVGFLADSRRINVAVTRARRHFCLIGDADTVKSNEVLRSLTEYLERWGHTINAVEYDDLQDYVPSYIPFKLEGHAGSKGKPKTQKNAKEKSTKNQMPDEHPVRVKSETNEAEEESLQKQIQEFVGDPSRTCLEFPATLNAYQRMIIHKASSRLGLLHSSYGTGDARHVVVKKRDRTDDIEEPAEASSGSILIEKFETMALALRKADETAEMDSDTSASNGDDQLSNEPQEQTPSAAGPSRLEHKKASGSKHQRVKKISFDINVGADDDDENVLLDRCIEENKRCAFTNCTRSVLLLCATCMHCSKLYCASHWTPESHGCADAARRDARQRNFNQLLKPLPDSKREQLKKKAQAKVCALQLTRGKGGKVVQKGKVYRRFSHD